MDDLKQITEEMRLGRKIGAGHVTARDLEDPATRLERGSEILASDGTPWAPGLEEPSATLQPILGPDGRQCAVCGCTSLQACGQVPSDESPFEEPCSWVADDLCSACEQSDEDEAYEALLIESMRRGLQGHRRVAPARRPATPPRQHPR